MTSTPPTSDRDRGRVWLWYAAAGAVVVAFVLLRSVLGPETAEHQIGEQAFDGESCFITVISNERVALQWPRATKAEVISCDTSETDPFPNGLMDYAQFESPTALAAALKVAPPDGTYCTIEDAVVVQYEYLGGFEAMCEHQGGTLHASSAE